MRILSKNGEWMRRKVRRRTDARAGGASLAGVQDWRSTGGGRVSLLGDDVGGVSPIVGGRHLRRSW